MMSSSLDTGVVGSNVSDMLVLRAVIDGEMRG